MNWTVTRRIATGFTISLVLMLVIAAIGAFALSRSQRAARAELQQQHEVLTPALLAEVEFQNANLFYLFYLLEREEQWIRQHDSTLALAGARLREVSGAVPEDGRAPWTAAISAVTQIAEPMRRSMAAARAGDQAEALRIRDEQVIPPRDQVYASINEGVAEAQRRTELISRDSESAASLSRALLLWGSLLALTAGILIAVMLNRAVAGPLQKTSAALATSAAEILASTTEQAASATETSAAVTETVTTVDEVAQTAEHAAERARAVSELSQRAAEIGRSGRAAVDRSVAGMDAIQAQVAGISERIGSLAQHANTIGEITATVTDIAEQTNLLALNAAVEAARAGDHGRGFAVVATEIRTLADEAKKATVQVRQILGEIQRATASAVMTTEQGTKQVAAGAQQIVESGETIRLLAEAVTEASQAAAQIVASAAQQAAGMAQIRQAMQNVHEATQQNLAATHQAEGAARDINSLGTDLLALVGADASGRRSPARA